MGAEETIVMPMSIFERDELGTADTSYRFATCETTFSEQFAETICAIWFVFAASKTCTSQTCLTMGTRETFSMPWFILICNTSTCNHLKKITKQLVKFLRQSLN